MIYGIILVALGAISLIASAIGEGGIGVFFILLGLVALVAGLGFIALARKLKK